MFFVMLAPLLLLCWLLSTHWAVNPQYSFGWLVPPLAGFLIWRRWTTRPQPTPVQSWISRLGIATSGIFGPFWLYAQPSPDWRMLNWILAIFAVTAACCAFGMRGGNRWFWHFSIPFAFVFTAIPWPLSVEKPVVQELMRVVAAWTSDLLNFGGIAAVPEGSIIQLKEGFLGVDEACSGVRSLQASLMAAVFFGELHRFGWLRRMALLGAALGIAIITNIGRTWFLAWRAAGEGMEAVTKYHDSAGFVVLGICFAALWAITAWIRQGHVEPAETNVSHFMQPRQAAWPLALWMGAWVIGAEIWFHSEKSQRGARWKFNFPENTQGFQRIQLSREGLRQLQADSAAGGAWQTGSRMWLAYSFQWEPGPARSRILARAHNPANCLPSTGWKIVERREPITFSIRETALSFSVSTFVKGDDVAHVYYCAWQGGKQMQMEEQNPWLATWHSVLQRERNLSQKVVQIVLIGPIDGAKADAGFLEEIYPLISATK